MRCCVPLCKNTLDNVSSAEGQWKGISFHSFPSEAHLRAAWLRALGKQDNLPDSAVVCSQHFLNDDIYETESGLRQIATGAIPSTVQVCMICLDTDSKLILMSKHKLEEVYEKITGHPLYDPGNLKRTLCVQCTQRLINFSRLREKSLRARALMMDLVEKHELITRRHIKMINRTKNQLKSNMVLTTLGPDHCDLHILEHPSEDKQTELQEFGHRFVLKTEESDDSMLVDKDMKLIYEDDNNVNDFDQDQLKLGSDDSIFVDKDMKLIYEDDNNVNDFDQDQLKLGSDDSMSVDKDMKLIYEDDNNVNDFDQDQLKLESVSFLYTCTLCLEEFVHEHEYMQHLAVHFQNGAGDGECATSQVCEPHTAVSSSSSHSSLITENKQANPSPSAHSSQTAVAPASASFATSSENKVHATKEADAEQELETHNVGSENRPADSKILTHCVVKLHDIFKKIEVPRRDSLTKTQKSLRSSHVQNIASTDSSDQTINQNEVPTTEYIEPITNSSSATEIVSKFLQSKVGGLTYYFNKQRNNSSRSSLYAEERSFTCDICRKSYIQKSLLVRHIKIHTGKKAFLCKVCGYRCDRNSHLVVHMRTHTGEKPYECNLCKYKCTTNGVLERHMKTHTGEKPFSCNLCDFTSSYSSHVARHMRTHTGMKPFSCKFCEYKCTQSNTLVTHKRIHTGEKPYYCKYCNYKSAASGSLASHMKSHTGEKPYTCKICEYKCAHKTSLLYHMRSHTGEKPYSCDLCKFKCSQSGNLKYHMRTHTGEKPYECKLCKYKFGRRSYLVKHMKTHTGEKTSWSRPARLTPPEDSV